MLHKMKDLLFTMKMGSKNRGKFFVKGYEGSDNYPFIHALD